MSEEEKKAIEELKQLREDFKVVDKIVKDREKQETKTIEAILNLIENQQKELDTLKEIEKSHQEENGKLRKEIKELEGIKADYIRRMKTSNEVLLKQGYISKDKIKKTQGELCMQLGSYVRDEASPEQERIAGGINIINKILKGE